MNVGSRARSLSEPGPGRRRCLPNVLPILPDDTVGLARVPVGVDDAGVEAVRGVGAPLVDVDAVDLAAVAPLDPEHVAHGPSLAGRAGRQSAGAALRRELE